MKTKTINIEIIGSQKEGLTRQEEKILKEYFQKKKKKKEEKLVNYNLT